MNKTLIISLLIVFLAVQGCNTQLFSFFASVVTSIFSIAINVTTTTFNFFVSFSVALSDAFAATLSAINTNIYNIIQSLNVTANNATVAAKSLAYLISNQSNAAYLLGLSTVGNFKDFAADLSAVSIALASISIGIAPTTLQGFAFSGVRYPVFSNNTKVSAQASAFIALSNFHIQNIQFVDQYLQTVLTFCPNSSASVNITVNASSVINLWVNMIGYANASITNTSNGLLLTASAGFSGNLSLALNATAQYVGQFQNITSALLNCTASQRYTVNCTGKSQAISNFSSTHLRWHRRGAINWMNNAITGLNSSLFNSIATLNNDLAKFKASVNGIATSSFVYNSAQAHANAHANLVVKSNNVFIGFGAFLNASSNGCEQNKTNVLFNVTGTVNTTVNTLFLEMLAKNVSGCLNYTNDVFQTFSSFILGTQTCAQTADNQTQTAISNAINSYPYVLQNISTFMNSASTCYKNGCSIAIINPFNPYGVQCANDPSMTATKVVLWPPSVTYSASSYATSIINCLTDLNSKINTYITGLDSSLASTYNALASQLSTIVSNLTTCVNNQVVIANTSLNAIRSNFTTCLNSTGIII